MSINLDFGMLMRSDHISAILSGVRVMLEMTLLTWLIAMVVGVLLATLRMTNSKILQFIVASYVEFHQNVPMLVHIFLWYFGFPALLPIVAQQWINGHDSGFYFACIAVGLVMAAYISEALRGGIRSIPHAQYEASRALGLSYLQTARKVIFPQAFRIALPPMVSHTVLLFKNTSLAMAIGVAELTYVTREIENTTFKTFEIYLLSTMIYLAISLMILATGSWLEARWRLIER
ncbi:amino acid ABC transporter permease [Orrella sp. NBD-18]|uniref:Amino acid ABC transporter permease n=1 Tax=Sheuella amnicola TaxID=2707330 RepID=A0A6B2R5F4_9BURK|nr:amino acid ABC transporter permease [Sheuella amnicola]NDY82575.1 amino acid ABC transporter permease [Sheuella amnicola]HBI82692.1 amino acid ABC transporter permease [Alcaligenaceae bacterium]